MKQLSGLDATFLYLETPEMPMHVGALHVFERPKGSKGRFVAALRHHIEERLPLTPVLRRRLWWMPLNLANPAWVDAEPDLKKHIVEVKLPASAKRGDGMAQLHAAVAELHPVLLDRKRPLWKMHVFEGLSPAANGNPRVALYTQLHHAAVDGQAAVALAQVILDLLPEPRALEIRPSTRARILRLDMGQMLRGAIGHQAGLIRRIITELPGAAGTLGKTAGQALANSPLLKPGAGGVSNLGLAPRTALNGSVTTGRAFATHTWPMAEVKALGQAHGATVNDIVLWLCATALRRYLSLKKALPRKSLVAAVPISLREKGDTTSDNQASMSLISLGTHLADPMRRLAHVKAATAAMKGTVGQVKGVLPTDFPSIGVPWLMEAVTALYGKARVAEKIPQVANLVISNVPGVPAPLYLAGARMLTNYPTSIVTHGLGLNITVQSYDRSLDVGLMADAQAMPDVSELADHLAVALDDLRAITHAAQAEAPTLATKGLRQARQVVEEAVQAAGGSLKRQVVRGAGQGVRALAGLAVAKALAPASPRKPRRPSAGRAKA